MARWKLLRGIHCDHRTRLVSYGEESRRMLNEDVPTRIPEKDPSWSDPDAPKTYYPGDIFDCDLDLSRHNQRGTAARFEKVGDGKPVTDAPKKKSDTPA